MPAELLPRTVMDAPLSFVIEPTKGEALLIWIPYRYEPPVRGIVVASVESVMVIVPVLAIAQAVVPQFEPAVTRIPVMLLPSFPAIAPPFVTELLLSIVTAAPPPTLMLPPLTIVTSPALDVASGVFCEAETLV